MNERVRIRNEQPRGGTYRDAGKTRKFRTKKQCDES